MVSMHYILQIYDINKDPNQPEQMYVEGAVGNDNNNNNNNRGGGYALKYTNERLRRLSTTATRTSTTAATTQPTPQTTANALIVRCVCITLNWDGTVFMIRIMLLTIPISPQLVESFNRKLVPHVGFTPSLLALRHSVRSESLHSCPSRFEKCKFFVAFWHFSLTRL